MRPTPISPRQATALGWTRVDPRPWGKLAARWEHRDGWKLHHCGHPTANWPWALYDPKGRMHLLGAAVNAVPQPTHGYAWPNLREAMTYVEQRGLAGIAVMDDLVERGSLEIRWHRRPPRGAGGSR